MKERDEKEMKERSYRYILFCEIKNKKLNISLFYYLL